MLKFLSLSLLFLSIISFSLIISTSIKMDSELIGYEESSLVCGESSVCINADSELIGYIETSLLSGGTGGGGSNGKKCQYNTPTCDDPQGAPWVNCEPVGNWEDCITGDPQDECNLIEQDKTVCQCKPLWPDYEDEQICDP